MKVLIWNEGRHERDSEAIRKVYPAGIHGQLAAFLGKNEDMEIRTATLDDPDQGLSDELLDETDVLLWWGHMAHHEVDDRWVDKIQQRVLCGMGLIVLHSGHMSKIFRRLMGTTCHLRWRDNERERIWTVLPGHPIARGIPESFPLEHEEMYGETFDIPQPDELVFIGWFRGGEVFRSGCCYHRGRGKVFYFQPGHEEYPTYYNETIQKVITNAVRWANTADKVAGIPCDCCPALEQ